MYLPPDLSLYVRDQDERGFLGNDVYEWLSWVTKSGSRLIDGFAPPRPGEGLRETRERLKREGLELESHYLAWRATASSIERRHSSLFCMDQLSETVGALIETAASVLLARGYETFDNRARLYLNRAYEFDHRKAIIKRAAWRCHADFRGYSSRMVIEARNYSNKLFNESEADELERAHELKDYLPPNFRIGMPNTARKVKVARKRQRRAIIRAINFAARLVGRERAHDFVRGGKFRIQGRLAVYELTARGRQTQAHGGATFVVRAKEDDAELCHLCIYTPGVPLMDHLASMVMHVDAGEEEMLLTTGNAYDIKPEAHTHEWLKPFLPVTAGPPEMIDPFALAMRERDVKHFVLGRMWTSRILGVFPIVPTHRPSVPLSKLDTGRDQQIMLRLSREITQSIWAEFGDALPEMSFNRHVLLKGYLPNPEHDFANDPSLRIAVPEEDLANWDDIPATVEPMKLAA